MLRTLTALIVTPVGLLLIVLSLTPLRPRADFVVATDALRTIDPQRVSWLDEIQVAAALFEGLTRLDPQTSQPVPGVAERWKWNATRDAVTFHLRADARWQTGDPVTAEDFRFAWLRALTPAVEAQYASLLFVIDGAEDYYRSRLNDDPSDDLAASDVGIDVIGDRTLRARLRGPCSYFLDLAAFPTFAPAHRPTLERWAFRDGRVLRATQHLWTRPANIVGNGAFVLREWSFKRRLVLRRNPHYWDADAIAADTIELDIITDPSSALIGYETGAIDLVRGLPLEIARVLADQTRRGLRDDFHIGDRFATFFFRVNCRRPPLDDARVRKALSLAIDRDALCEHVLGLGDSPALTYVPRGAIKLMPRTAPDGSTIYYQPPDGLGAALSYEERVRLARELLADAGFYRQSPERPIEISFASDQPQQRRIAEAIQVMWERELGIRVALRVLERKVLSQRIRQLDYDIVRSDWYGDY
ncbi:MAG: peptide ABC transporter substrate-binding protein, partial [Planctomycetota bacterium]